MPRVELGPEVLDDLDRSLEHLAEHEVADTPARISGIVQAIQVLSHGPLFGRQVKGGMRALVIGARGAWLCRAISRRYARRYRIDIGDPPPARARR